MTSSAYNARALVGGLLTGHPEARTLQSEASHWHGLAAHSAALAAAASRGADLARLRYEELRRRLDPRGHRRTRFGVACALVAAIGLVLAGLARMEVAPWIDVTRCSAGWLVAAAMAVLWLSGAWLAALPGRLRRVLLAVAAGVLTALLSGLVGTLPALLLAVLSGLLAVVAAALIARAAAGRAGPAPPPLAPRLSPRQRRGGHRAVRRRGRHHYQGKLAWPGSLGYRSGRRATGPRSGRRRGRLDLVRPNEVPD